MKEHKAARKRAEEEEIAAIKANPDAILDPSTIQTSLNGARSGEDLIVSGGQVKRAGHDRWSKRKEKIFFDELAATNNIQRSAAAAGVSANAVHTRRLKHPVFAAKWDAVVRCAKASIDLYTVEAARKTFDPDQLDIGDVTPKVTIDQALKIAHSGSSSKTHRDAQTSWHEEPDAIDPDEVEAARERIIRRLQRIRAREMPRKLAAGWSYDESHDLLIPPGWVKGPNYKPKDPDLPVDFYWR